MIASTQKQGSTLYAQQDCPVHCEGIFRMVAVVKRKEGIELIFCGCSAFEEFVP
jgi:hypothetical protein